MLKEILENVRNTVPLVHNITNYVTVNDCANILIACGGSPIMSDEIEDVIDITAICGGLNINIGTLNTKTIPAMLAAGRKSNELSHPVVLDPVGAGASKLRTETANQLLKDIKFSVIKGNISEIKTLALGTGTTKGVDADVADTVTVETLAEVIAFANQFAKDMESVIVITGAIDIVADGKRACVIKNGHQMMSEITGTGCMLSTLLAAYIVANQDNIFEAVIAAVCSMGLCGEIAFQRMSQADGNSSYRNYLIDAVYNLDGDSLETGANYEIH
ncbi:hydroxyethylthiazole kinase [Eubacteriaceae bacterium ES3]|nr:hydroxyethylthiazole kinase [Eubacteriaceae bacterium ES3]